MLTLRAVRSNASTRRQLAATPLPTAAASLAATLTSQWAPSTLRDHQSLWARFQNFLQDHGLPQSDRAAALFVSATNTMPSTKLTYAKELTAIFNRAGLPSDFLRMLASGLRGQGALIPEHQATPISRAHLEQLANSFPPQDAAAILLAWKTASRWDEITRLTAKHFKHRSDEAIILDWGTDTKASRAAPNRESRFVEVRGPWTARINRSISFTTPTQRLTSLSMAALIARMAEMFPDANYSAHSIKRGAMNAALQALQTDRGSLSSDDLRALATLSKHQTDQHALPPVSISYLGEEQTLPALARAIGTGRVTQLL